MSRFRVGRSALLSLALGLGVFAFHFGVRRVYPFTIDDAGIAFAYAEHIAHGLGFRAVVSGPTVEGYSDFSWVMLLATLAKLGLSPMRVGKPLGVLLFAVAAALSFFFVENATRNTSGGARRFGFPEILPTVLLAVCPEFVAWAPSGLENALLWALLLAACVSDARETDDATRFPLSAVFGVGIALTRPEGAVYAAIVGLGKLWDALRRPSHRRQLGVFVLMLGLPLAAYHSWHHARFSSFVPNTYYAKAPGAGPIAEGVTYLKKGLSATSLPYLLPLILASLIGSPRKCIPPFLMGAFGLAFALESRGDWMPHYRFVGYAMVPLVTLAGVGVRVLADFGERVIRKGTAEYGATLLALVTSALWFRHHAPRYPTIDRLTWCHLCSRLSDTDDHLKVAGRLGLKEATFLTHDFGGPSYLSTRSFEPLDLVGLCDRSAAKIIYANKVAWSIRVDQRRAQYFFHEQDEPPTLLYFPSNFWMYFSDLPEARYDYAEVKMPRTAGRVFAPTRVFRGRFVDFFPKVERFLFEPLGPRFSLVGASAHVLAGGGVLVQASVIQRSPSAEPAVFVLRRGGKESAERALFAGMPALLREMRSDEPLRVELTAPRAPEGAMLELGVRRLGAPTAWLRLDVTPAGAADASPPLPFPNDLPSASDDELLRLGTEVARLVARRHETGDRTLRDPALGRALREHGDRGPDSYLAYVWATRADPDLTGPLADRIFSLRPPDRRPGYLMERTLLGNFYQSGDPEWQVHLVHFYVGERLWDKATYFADRLPAHAPQVEDATWTLAVSAAKTAAKTRTDDPRASGYLATRGLPGIDSNRFSGKTPQGWHETGHLFHAESGLRARLSTIPASAFEGDEFLSSGDAPGFRGFATVETDPFLVEGRALSFLFSGTTDHRVLAELLVDGAVVASSRAPGSATFFPTFWDVRAYRGKHAVVRLTDRSPTGALAVDDFRLWDTLSNETAESPAGVTEETDPEPSRAPGAPAPAPRP